MLHEFGIMRSLDIAYISSVWILARVEVEHWLDQRLLGNLDAVSVVVIV